MALTANAVTDEQVDLVLSATRDFEYYRGIAISARIAQDAFCMPPSKDAGAYAHRMFDEETARLAKCRSEADAAESSAREQLRSVLAELVEASR